MENSTIRDLKEYLNTCLRNKSYNECNSNDQVCNVVARWLSTKSYNDYYVYLAWFAMREVLLKKCKTIPINGDVVKTMMEYPAEFAKYIGDGIDIDSIDTTKTKWVYEWLKDDTDRMLYIYKIISVAKKFKNDLAGYNYADNIPDVISGELQGDGIHTLTQISANDCITSIIAFLKESLCNGEWMYKESFKNNYSYNMFDWIMKFCHQMQYEERVVQCIYAAILFILEYGYNVEVTFANCNDEVYFWKKHKKLFDMSSRNSVNVFGHVYPYPYVSLTGIVSDINMDCTNYGGFINKEDVTIDLPEIISPFTPKTANKHISKIDILSTCMSTFHNIETAIIKDAKNEQKQYTREDIYRIISSIEDLKYRLME